MGTFEAKWVIHPLFLFFIVLLLLLFPKVAVGLLSVYVITVVVHYWMQSRVRTQKVICCNIGFEKLVQDIDEWFKKVEVLLSSGGSCEDVKKLVARGYALVMYLHHMINFTEALTRNEKGVNPLRELEDKIEDKISELQKICGGM